VGAPGELAIGGVALARGYLGRPALTAERFVPDPFGPLPGRRLYRTGDRVRLSPRGEVEFLGRLDHQVKLRGFRIELGEIEAALLAHPRVTQAAVVLREDGGRDPRLAAYLEVADAPPPAAAELRDHLRRRLPDPMVPAHFVVLPALPRTPSGKVDRRALPAPGAARPAGEGAAYLPPRSAEEERMAALWSDVLGVERVGIEDNFFDLGGHSLSAARLLARVRAEMGVELPLAAVFQAPTVAALAAAAAACGRGAPARPERIARVARQARRRSG
jgi:acyl carrier protein